jgi:cytidylate kinase
MTRTIEAIVEEQARRWQLARVERHEEPRRPVITISRQHGARGGDVAQRLADDLKLDLFDREIIHRIAESAHLGEIVVTALDEHNRALLTDWMASVVSRDYLSAAEYRYHLTRVLGAVAHHGGAVIMGHGAHLILGQGEALRVLVVAPLEKRIQTVMEREKLGEKEAQRRIAAVEGDRRAFLLQYFHTDLGDPASFDLVVNTSVLGVEGAARAVENALPALPSSPVGQSISR